MTLLCNPGLRNASRRLAWPRNIAKLVPRVSSWMGFRRDGWRTWRNLVIEIALQFGVHNGRDSLQTESESPLLICPPDSRRAAPRWRYFADSSSTQFELTSSSTLFKQRPRSGGLPRLLISVPPSVTTNVRESANKFTRRVAGSYSLERQCAQCNIAIPQTSMLIAVSVVVLLRKKKTAIKNIVPAR